MTKQNNTLIETRALSKSYPRKNNSPIVVINEINLEIKEGEFLAIIGQSGSGKTTLLNLIGTLDRPTSGKVIFKEKDLCEYSSKELALFRRKQIGFVFQTFNLLPALTVSENIESAVIHSKIPKAELKNKIADMLCQFDLEDKADRLPSELSIGQQQKVAIARALINDPALIIADEPLGEMDPIAGREILERLIKLNKKLNITLIVASHNSAIEKYADRSIFLSEGKIVPKKETKY